MIIDKEDIDLTIRVAGSITFKNYIKRNWGCSSEDGEPDKIHESDRLAIKSMIVPLMLKSPVIIQKQLSDAVSIIGKYDFPKKWPQLIDEMIDKFQTGDFHVINGVLKTAHSLFKRYRYEFKSQTLWEEIKYVLDKISKPLTDLLTATMGLASQHAGDVSALKVIYDSLELMCKVFNSLNSQDLPEFFEDNMETWMTAFHSLLVTNVPCLQSADDCEAGVIEMLRSQICDNITLYAQKYDEEFGPYMPKFVTAVWELLVNTGLETKFDGLVSNALQFLSTVAGRNQYRHLFEDPAVLASICEKVIVPNMDFRTSDEELFEDNPEEYIRRDIEGSDIDTRRRAVSDLVRTLSQHFEQKIVDLFGQYLTVLLERYKMDPRNNWRSKDTAIYLVTSLASKGATQKHGVTQTSQLVPLPHFCMQQVIPELERENINDIPVLKADALKFLMTFRSLLGPEILTGAIPHIIRHLNADSSVVHSYASCCIDKMLIIKDPSGKPIISAEILSPYATQLIQGLFITLQKPGSNENEYVMKAIMRSFHTLDQQSMPFMGQALPRLTEILTQVSRNPSKPHFNHYLFESISLAITIVCKVEPKAVTSFEEALFPIFQHILQEDIMEFLPYVFQMLSLLMEVREVMGTIPDPYLALFPCLLSPTLWERPGNITPLIRLLCTFVRQASPHIQADQKLMGVLGVFQKMIASKANDHEGFHLMQYLISYYPFNELQPNMKQIFSLLFQRLSSSKTTKFVKSLIVFFNFYAAKVGGPALIELIDGIQNQMFGMVCQRVFLTDLNKVSGDLERKIVTIGITKILCESPQMLIQPYVSNWMPLVKVSEIFAIISLDSQKKFYFRPSLNFLSCHQMTRILMMIHSLK
jgi:exportin-2 (importin alpha re-exporter)